MPLLISTAPVKNPFYIHIYYQDKILIREAFPLFMKVFKGFLRPISAQFFNLADMTHEIEGDYRVKREPEKIISEDDEKLFPFYTASIPGVVPDIEDFLLGEESKDITRLEMDCACRLRVSANKFSVKSHKWCTGEEDTTPLMRVKIYNYEIVFETTARCFLWRTPQHWDYQPEWADENYRQLSTDIGEFSAKLGSKVEKIQIDWYKAPPVYYGLEMDRLDDVFRGMPLYEPFPLLRLEHRLNYALIDAIDELLYGIEKFVEKHWEAVNSGTSLSTENYSKARSYLSSLRQTLDELKNFAYSITGIPLRKVHHEYVPVRVGPLFLKLQELITIQKRIVDQ